MQRSRRSAGTVCPQRPACCATPCCRRRTPGSVRRGRPPTARRRTWSSRSRGRRRAGTTAPSLRWRDALIVDPDAVADDELGDTPLAELLDDAEELGLEGAPRAWIPALAALRRLVLLPSWCEACPADAPPARQVTALLAQLGRARRERTADALVVDLKRRITALAPGLRERLRGA